MGYSRSSCLMASYRTRKLRSLYKEKAKVEIESNTLAGTNTFAQVGVF